MTNTHSRPEEFFLKKWHPYAWIAIVAALLYFKTLFFNFNYLDDHVLIVHNYQFLSDISNIVKAFTGKVFNDSFLPYYRPLLMVSFILDAQLGGISPFIYHLTNVTIHIIASSLVFTFFIKLRYDKSAALFFGILFAVHPVLTQAVAWIPGRNDSLMAVFILASFIAFMNLLKDDKNIYYICHELFFALALFTKESALILIVMCALYIGLISKEKPSSILLRRIFLGWFTVTASWVIIRHFALHGAENVTIFDIGGLIFLYLPAIVQFIGKMLLPFNLSVFPILEDASFIYGYITVACLSVLLLLTKNKRYNFIIFGFAWMVLFLLPSLIRANFKTSADFLEHRVYLPILGFMIIMLESVAMDGFSFRNAKAVAAAILILCIFFVTAFNYSGNFKDRFTFWENAVKNSPNSPFAHQVLGTLYHIEGALNKAETEYAKSLNISPLQPEILENLGNIYFRKNLLKKAEVQYRKALALYPYSCRMYVTLGVIYYRNGDLQKAESCWKKTIAMSPFDIEANKDLAIYYFEKNDLTKSRYFTKRLRGIGVRPPEKFLKSLGIS